MQEQPHYKIKPDQGWAKMKPILDEAMPVNKPSRRFPFMWWTTSAVVVTALVGIALLNGAGRVADHANPKNPKFQISAPGVERIDETNAKSSATEMQLSEEAKADPALLNNPVTNTNQVKTSLEQKIIAPDKETQLGQKSTRVPSPAGRTLKKQESTVPMAMADPPVSQQSTLSTDNQFTGVVALPVGHNSIGLVNEAIGGDVEMYTPAPRNKFVVEPIPSIDELSLAGIEPAAASIPEGTVQKGRRQPAFIEPNVAISGFSGKHGGLGWTGSVGANMNLSRRFSITSSVGYFSFHQNSSLFGSGPSRDESVEYNAILNYDPSNAGNETYVDAESISKEASYSVIIPLVEKLTQWQVSAGLKWKFSRRFYTEGGIQFGFGTMGYSEYPIASTDGLGTSTPALSFVNSLNEFKVIRSTSTAFYAGLGYRIGQHIDLFANYTHAFDPYLLSSLASTTADQFSGSRTDYIRGINLGLRYTL